MSTLIQIGIGLAVTYLLLSLLVTQANELLTAVLRRRARHLYAAINDLISKSLAKDVYAHGLVQSLHSNGRPPSYIPSHVFATVLTEVLGSNGAAPDRAIRPIDVAQGLARLTERATKAAEPAKAMAAPTNSPAASASNASAGTATATTLTAELLVLQALTTLWNQSANDVNAFMTSVEGWFNDKMERVSGWYKRWTQLILLPLGLVATVVMHVDTLDMLTALQTNPALLTAMADMGGKLVAQPKDQAVNPAKIGEQAAAADGAANAPQQDEAAALDNLKTRAADLQTLQLLGAPIGWTDKKGPRPLPWLTDEWNTSPLAVISATLYTHWLGWLLTALAVSLGAPFWFDVLNRFVGIRAAGKAPEEAPKLPKQVPQPLEPGGHPSSVRSARPLRQVVVR